MPSDSSPKLRLTVLLTIYEYFLITLPVASYVGVEAFARRSGVFFLASPEWAIATIFLLFQGLSLYLRGLDRTGRGLWHLSLGMLGMVVLLLVAIAAINAYYSLDALHHTQIDSTPSIVLRIALFAVASLTFLLLVASGKFAALNAGD